MSRQTYKFAKPCCIFIFSVVFATSCAKDDNANSNPPQIAPPQSKPVPPCSDNDYVSMTFEWNQNPLAFKYETEFGYLNQAAFELKFGDKNMNHYTFSKGQRGHAYEITVNRQLLSGRMDQVYKMLEIPSCVDLENYLSLHPDYDEPVTVELKF